MKNKETFIGPCSKFVDGQGWTTEIPVEMLKEKGYIKIKDLDEKFVSLNAVKAAENCPKAMKTLVESVGCVQKDTAKEIYGEIGDSDILVVETQEYGEIEVVPMERLKEIIKSKGVEVD